LSFLLALDQGTSSSRSIVFDRAGGIVAIAQREITQIYPQAGWVEHDPMEIWATQLATAREALAGAGLAAREISALGITNQRETTIVWDRRSGEPVYNAIVWQDRRGEALCAELRARGLARAVQEKTGLIIESYFSASKLRWIIDRVPGARERAQRGELLFGTVDCWLLWQLTGGRVHATDVSNASRTMLYNVRHSGWDAELLEALAVPAEMLPAVRPSSYPYAHSDAHLLGAQIPIGGIAGDQQSALFGQGCVRAGMAKNTYGTGCFMLMHTGSRMERSASGLVTTRTAQVGQTSEYALEGSVFVGGAVVQWLRDGLRAIRGSHEIQELAASVPDSGGVMFVPAFAGLGAPYWKPHVTGAIVGLTHGSSVAHIARAALESIAFQSAALLSAMSRDALAAGGAPVGELRVDGGACVNDLLMQFQADLLRIPVVRPRVIQTTALGAAYLAGLSVGVYRHLDELANLATTERTFYPTMSESRAAALTGQWEHAVRQTVLEPAVGTALQV
jgi:glycerol kinase